LESELQKKNSQILKASSNLPKAKQADFQVEASQGQPAAKHHGARFINLAATQVVGITPWSPIKRYHFPVPTLQIASGL
jgi:hypothetical protein